MHDGHVCRKRHARKGLCRAYGAPRHGGGIRFATRVIAMVGGRIVADGSPAALLADTRVLAAVRVAQPQVIELSSALVRAGHTEFDGLSEVADVVDCIASIAGDAVELEEVCCG